MMLLTDIKVVFPAVIYINPSSYEILLSTEIPKITNTIYIKLI